MVLFLTGLQFLACKMLGWGEMLLNEVISGLVCGCYFGVVSHLVF